MTGEKKKPPVEDDRRLVTVIIKDYSTNYFSETRFAISAAEKEKLDELLDMFSCWVAEQ